MKPLRLTMTAFGPYKAKETIDFQELQQHRLFAISGQTGAGKTTIFDGISFALYGSGSGEDRKDTKSMRSDFADDKDYTAVELVFELRGKTYRVLRQLGHVKQGNKTATGERYEFFEVHADSSETPAVDRQKVSDINKRIEELLGLTQQQFKQIVMLPQGEFRKLLTSDSKEKEEILRKIFKTEPLDQLVKQLDVKRTTLAKDSAAAKAKFDASVQQLAVLPPRDSELFRVLRESPQNMYQLLSALDEEAAHYREALPTLTQQLADTQQQHDALQQQLGAAERLNEQLAQLEQAKAHYASLQARHDDMMAMRETWQLADTAATIQPYFVQLQQARMHEQQAIADVEAAIAQQQTMKQQLAEVKKQYDQLASEQQQRDEQRLAIDRLEQLKPLFAEQRRLTEQLRSDTTALQQAQQHYDEHVERLTQFIERLQQEKHKLHDLQQAAEPLEEQRRQLQILHAQWQAYEQLQRQQQVVQQSFSVATKQHEAYVANDSAYREAYDKWLQNEAAQLADLLLDGEPCSVCGSTEHPHRAVHQDGVATKAQLDVLRQQATAAQQAYTQAQAEYTQAQQLQASYVTTCEELHVPLQQITTLQASMQATEQAVAAAFDANEAVKKLRVKIDNAEQKLVVEQQNERQQKDALQQLTTTLAVTTTSLQQLQQRMPKHIATSDELQRELLQLQQAYKESMQAWQHIEELYQATDKQCGTATERVAFTQQVHMQVTAQREHAEQVWQQQMASSFTTIAQFEAALQPVEAREQMKEQLECYRDELQRAKAIIENSEQLATTKRVDVAALHEQIVTHAQALQAMTEQHQQYKQALQHCETMHDSFTTMQSETAALMQTEQELTTLYDLLRGKNAKKVSFERYVQIGFLEQITEAANIRLRYLSNGQFTLQCSDRLESGGKQSGLSLDVYDAYTGLLRDVKTLSGGEKFNASLALALGMADVIQSFEGNIQIETMFIDEGFGSLDEETLTKAIDTLVDLQKSGRMIGIISHVQELKDAMPAVLQVTKTKEGYSTTEFILK